MEIDRHIDILLGKGFVEKEEIAKLAQIHSIDENDIKDPDPFEVRRKTK